MKLLIAAFVFLLAGCASNNSYRLLDAPPALFDCEAINLGILSDWSMTINRDTLLGKNGYQSSDSRAKQPVSI